MADLIKGKTIQDEDVYANSVSKFSDFKPVKPVEPKLETQTSAASQAESTKKDEK